jgi:hypothetical protein
MLPQIRKSFHIILFLKRNSSYSKKFKEKNCDEYLKGSSIYDVMQFWPIFEPTPHLFIIKALDMLSQKIRKALTLSLQNHDAFIK